VNFGASGHSLVSEARFYELLENVFETYIFGSVRVKRDTERSELRNQMKGIKALARHLDISISSVSKALNGRFDINPETRKRVLEAAAELGYVANQSGRSLRQGATRTVGFMIESAQAAPTDSDNFFMAVFDGVQTVFRRHHLDLIVLPCASDEDPAEYLGRMVARGLVDAVIVSATRKSDTRVPLLMKAGMPFVTLGRTGNEEHPWIELDFEGVARASVQRLVERGHREIAVALPASDLNLGQLFLSGYRKGLRANRIPFAADLVMRIESSELGGYALGSRLLERSPRPTAVILSYELTAGGLYRRLYEAGVSPGSGMAVIGFRDSPSTRYLDPKLTSFATSLRDLGLALGELLLSQMASLKEHYPNIALHQTWPLTLVPGQSDPPLEKRGARKLRP
jgi:DNA-binding LacI/PurR family transcriptional regulator